MGFNGGFLVRVCVIWVSGYSYLDQGQSNNIMQTIIETIIASSTFTNTTKDPKHPAYHKDRLVCPSTRPQP